jgi:GTP-binding protein Era
MTRAGFATIIGRPNVGKSTLVNAIMGEKVSITSNTPNTTRSAVRGILTTGDTQVIFVDTPGLHKPKSSLGGRLNDAARGAVEDVDVVIAMVDCGAAIGIGDRMVLKMLIETCRHAEGPRPFVVVNKVDRTAREAIATQLISAVDTVVELANELGDPSFLDRVEYFPTSARTGDGVPALVAAVKNSMPESPFLFDDDIVSDVSEQAWIAELVREQLVRKTFEEIPHSIHCRVAEYEWPHITVEILVERDSQKGMVIGKGGALLKDVGIATRRQLPEGAFLELRVRVEPSWQKRDDILDRLGY